MCDIKVNYYESDCHTVHQSRVSLTIGYSSEGFIKDTLRYRDGTISMTALRNHCSVKGNSTRNIAKAK